LPGRLALVNSTLSGTVVSHQGGGLYVIGEADLNASNVTIAGNQVIRPIGQSYPARGGGVFITTTAQITAQDTLLGDTVFSNDNSLPTPSDCFEPLISLGNDLIEELSTSLVSGVTTGNVTGQDPPLGPLHNNGGWIPTRVLLPGSPAIDAGRHARCIDAFAGFSKPTSVASGGAS